MLENASQNGSQKQWKINEKADLGTPATTEPHFGIPGTKIYQNVKNMWMQNLFRKEKQTMLSENVSVSKFL